HAEHGHRHPADPAVLGEGDLLAAVERAAVRELAAQLDRREVRGDGQPDQVEGGQHERRMDAADVAPGGGERRHGAAAAPTAAASSVYPAPVNAVPLISNVGVDVTPARAASAIPSRTKAAAAGE